MPGLLTSRRISATFSSKTMGRLCSWWSRVEGQQWSWGPQGDGAQSFGRAKRCACRWSGRGSTSMAVYVEMSEAFQS